MKLSNSQIDTYSLCGYKWFLHYIQKLRPLTTSSAFVFGKAIDNALNRLLLEKKKELTEEEKEIMKKDPSIHFVETMEKYEINNQLVEIKFSDKVNYFKKDMDISLLQSEDYKLIKEAPLSLEIDSVNIKTFQEECDRLKKECGFLEGDILLMHNYICWLSLYRKGLMLLEAYKTSILPEIKEVISIQKEVNLGGGENTLIGFIDFEAIFKDEDFIRVVDNKTSSGLYSEEKILNSQQLAIYSEFTQNPYVAYCVLDKNINKKPPRVKTQILKGEITDELKEKVFAKTGEVCYNIKEGNFDKNNEGCFSFGQKCPYYNYCRTGDLKGLLQLEKEEK